MRYICAQPAIKYYAWQVEVMLNNFIEQGINPNNIDIVCSKVNGILPIEWSKLADNYAARFFFYEDTRETKHYISSIRPNILKQHFLAHPYLTDEVVFYHDCDIAFTKPVDYSSLEMNDICYGSDTISYIGHNYIKEKGEDVLDLMCNIVGIDKKLVEENEANSIGAQYILKGIDYKFWEKVEKDSERLFKEVTELNNSKKEVDPKYHELQIWCADMWAVLWNIWKLGKKTKVEKSLAMTWATSHVDEWDINSIFHNAGVSNSSSGSFYKGDYIDKLPYNLDLPIKENFASFKYWQEIQKTGFKTVLI